jgi:SAM-dependent methyltransferase
MKAAAAHPEKSPRDVAIIDEVTSVVRSHPGVHDVAVYRQSDSEIVGFVVPQEKYVDEVLGGREAEGTLLRRWRKTYDLSQLTKAAATSEFAFNIAGWNSSYTRQPLPAEHMQEWVQTTVDRIATLAPTEVLEIGCGTGLLLLRLAPNCKRYRGTDFATSVIRNLKAQLSLAKGLSSKVEVLERSADDFGGLAAYSFSTVILNSSAQYFPSRSYLERVIEDALGVVRPGGHIFIGDMRNFVLQRVQAASIESFQAGSDLKVADVRERVDSRVHQEHELVPSPGYFLTLTHKFPQISRVDIYPRRGLFDNEMTRFRFDAILGIGGSTNPMPIEFFDPPHRGWDLKQIRSRLNGHKGEGMGFARILNSRSERDVELCERLATAAPDGLFSELRNEIEERPLQGIHPEAIFLLAAESGYRVAISWAACYPNGSYDAVFVRKSEGQAFPTIDWPQPSAQSLVRLSSMPAQSAVHDKLVGELISHCRIKLASEAVPKHVCLVDSIPYREGHTVDYEALLSATRLPR